MQAPDQMTLSSPKRSRRSIGVDIVHFDPVAADMADWQAYHTYRRIRRDEAWLDDPIPSDSEFEEDLRQPDPLGNSLRWMARARDGTVAGNAFAYILNPDSPGYAENARFLNGSGAVIGPFRGRGIGARLLTHLHDLMVGHDKTILTVTTHEADGHGFLRHIGASEKLRSLENRLPMAAVDWAMLEQWRAAADACGMRFDHYGPRVPMDVQESLSPLMMSLAEDVPVDDLERAPIRFEMRWIKEWYRELDRIGGAHHMIVLRDRDGSPVGLTAVEWHSRMPGLVWQHLTGVRRDKRGSGLAKALKAAMMCLVRDELPTVATVVTSNARSNAAMLAVNKALGFSGYRDYGYYQIDREAIGAWIGRRAGRRGTATARGVASARVSAEPGTPRPACRRAPRVPETPAPRRRRLAPRAYGVRQRRS